jgi:DNA-binding NarL/FixJ family response regulator
VDFQASLAKKKTKLLSDRVIGKQAFDIVVAPDAAGVTTLLFKVDYQLQSDFLQKLCDYALTKRELVVAKMMGQGFANREISKKLYISLATVKTHINRIYSKIDRHTEIFSQLRMGRTSIY